MELDKLDATFVIDTFLLLLIGVGPKIALVPFLEATSGMAKTPSGASCARCSPPPASSRWPC